MTEEDKQEFYSPEKFQKEVEAIVLEDHCTWLEAVITFCTENSLDVEDAAKLVTPVMRYHIEKDGVSSGLLRPRIDVTDALFGEENNAL